MGPPAMPAALCGVGALPLAPLSGSRAAMPMVTEGGVLARLVDGDGRGIALQVEGRHAC